MKIMLTARAFLTAIVAASLCAAGCALDDGSAPAMVGPSEFGLSITATATPNLLPRDGASQSVVTVNVRDAQNRPVAGQRVTLEATPSAARLSVREVVTDTNGQATFNITAPPSSAISGGSVLVVATPVGSASGGAFPRTIEIQLSGANNTTLPEPDFEVVPSQLEVNRTGVFDASKTKDENAVCLDACRYDWDFGDGSVATGRVVSHAFAVAKSYTVRLTVTDAAGTTNSIVRDLSVRSVAAPTVTIAVTPDPPFVDHQAVFTATAGVAPGHSIVGYEWNFGDGTTASTTTPSVVKTYYAVGTFVVTITAIDDLGQSGIGAKTVVVGYSAAAPVANFTVAPTGPSAGANVTFNGSTSTAGVGATIDHYVWDFGDGSAAQDTGTTPTVVHVYAAAGSYATTLTVIDNFGRQSSKTATVTVVP